MSPKNTPMSTNTFIIITPRSLMAKLTTNRWGTCRRCFTRAIEAITKTNMPVLRISLGSNIRIVSFRRSDFAKTDQSPYIFFVVLIGFCRYLNLRIVGFCRSKNLSKMTVPVRLRTFNPFYYFPPSPPLPHQSL